MISTACYPYPVNGRSTAQRAAMQPHIYSPFESYTLPRNIMYPYPHVSGSPSTSPNYVSSGYYEHYYPKNSWSGVVPGSLSTCYPHPLSSSLPKTTVNAKVMILPPQPTLVSDIDTPSSISSHSVLTPSSPFAREVGNAAGFQSMELDEFDYDDDEDDFDSDFADEMEGIDETDLDDALVYGASALHAIKSTSALEGALGDTPSSSCNTDLASVSPADRRLSASVPGYPSASSRTSHQRLTSSSPEVSHPSQHTYTHRNYTSLTSLSAQTSLSSSLYHHMASSSSLAGAFTSPAQSPHASRPTPHPLPILQPQPIRPIPPIPLADLTSSVDDGGSPDPCAPRASLRPLSPIPLLCQPVSDAVRYQLKEAPSNGGLRGVYGQEEHMSDAMCEDVITASEGQPRFTQHGLTFRQAHPSTVGACSVGEKIYSYGCVGLPIRWS